MAFCGNCGAPMAEGSVSYCANCGAPAAALVAKASEEKDFLDVTARLLRWERKAWSINGNVLVIVGAIFAAIYLLLALIFVSVDEMMFIVHVYFIFACIFGCVFVGIGIANKVVAKKLGGYLDGFAENPLPGIKRSSCVGMIVFCAFFNEIALVFYIINFVRMKANKAVIDSIMHKQYRC